MLQTGHSTTDEELHPRSEAQHASTWVVSRLPADVVCAVTLAIVLGSRVLFLNPVMEEFPTACPESSGPFPGRNASIDT